MTEGAAIQTLRVKPQQGNNLESTRSNNSNRSSRMLRSVRVSRGNQYMVGNRARRRIIFWQIVTAIRRLVVIAAAIQYIYISSAATVRTLQSLSGVHNPRESFRIFTTTLITGYTGNGLIKDSLLVNKVLGGDMTPRNYSIFLESKNKTSHTNCSSVAKFNPAIYNYTFLTHSYKEMVQDAQYNFTILSQLELVAVVVDCSFTQLKAGDKAMVRFFNVVRSRSDPTDLYLVTVSMNVQEYEIAEHNKKGPGLLAMLTIVRDMNETNVKQHTLYATTYPYQRSMSFEACEWLGITPDSYLELRTIPRDPLTQPPKHLITARKRGFFDGEDQSNIRYMYSIVGNTNAKNAVTNWEWLGEAVIADSWAWVHGIHLYFGLQTIRSLVVLGLVTYQQIRSGKMWIGDPFASVSTAGLFIRGILVWLSWYIDSFWTPFEFSMMEGGLISKTQIVRVHDELEHADVLSVFLSLVGVLSTIIRERIDPSIAIFSFEAVHAHRLQMVNETAAIHNEVVAYSNSIFYIGVAQMAPVITKMAPLRLWTDFQIPKSKSSTFLANSFFPEFMLLVSVAGFGVLRKINRRFYPEKIHTRSSIQSTDRSMNEKTALTMKGTVTNFEISTGAELQTRFGLVSDYSNYVYFKGMKFASADGVYCSGYVIVNGKYLVSSKDLLAIILIKVVRARFTNVYIYEVDGNTVKDTARLAYPTTFKWSDLWRLNITVLL